ncbi:MAG: 50S ribosomal protein L10 [Candidatus Magasanikbacteria bacterium]|jgi:large subunit ribosomal protein L10
MPKSRQQKEVTVKALLDGLKAGKAAVFANFQGLTVAQTEELRKNCRQEGVQMLAAKKTLVRRVFDELGIKDIDPKTFTGGVATFIGVADEVAPAKLVNTFGKKNEAVVIFGGMLEGKYITSASVKSLAALPNKQQLLGQLVGTLNAPVSGFVNVLAGNLRGLVGVLNNIAKSKA